MAASCRFAFAVHILTVLASKQDGVTSDLIAGSVNTNPVVIRRLLSALQQAGLVCTQKGARRGSQLCRPAQEISLGDVYRAVETGSSIAGHPQPPNPRCPVGRGIAEVLQKVCAAAQSAMESELSRTTLADVLQAIAHPLGSPERKSGARRQTA